MDGGARWSAIWIAEITGGTWSENLTRGVRDILSGLSSVVALTADGDADFAAIYSIPGSRWILPESHVCDLGECERVAVPGQQIEYRPCRRHALILAFLSSWLATVILAMNQEFAAEEDPPPFREETRRATRKVKGDGKKYQEVAVEHCFRIVTFDIAKKRRAAHPESVTSELRPNWIMQEDAAGLVPLWARRHIGQTERRLLPGPNKPWKEERIVDVSAHDKRVRVSRRALRETVTKLVASPRSVSHPPERSHADADRSIHL